MSFFIPIFSSYSGYKDTTTEFFQINDTEGFVIAILFLIFFLYLIKFFYHNNIHFLYVALILITLDLGFSYWAGNNNFRKRNKYYVTKIENLEIKNLKEEILELKKIKMKDKN